MEIQGDYVGGLNSYTFGLLDAFSRLKPDGNTFQIYASPENAGLFSKYTDSELFSIHIIKDLKYKRQILWRLLSFGSAFIYEQARNFLYRNEAGLMDSNSDIIYTPTTTLFYYKHKIPTVLSMHDIQQTHYPEFFSPSEIKTREVSYGLSARHVDCLQASSEFSKSDFLGHFKFLNEKQVTVIHEGVDLARFGSNSDSSYLSEKYHLPKQYLFYPAQLWHHKNHLALLRALQQLKAEGLVVPLVLSGANFSAEGAVRSFISEHLSGQVYLLGKVPSEDIAGLYQRARFLIMPSLHESNSLPILESAAAGTPVLASDIPPNIELSKILKLNIFDRHNPESIANSIRMNWSDENLIREQKIFNAKAIPFYSWDDSAMQYIRLFKSIFQRSIIT